MTDDGRLYEETHLAAQADALLRNVIFQGAIAAVREEYTKAWTASRPDDTAGREHAYIKLHVLNDIVTRLEILIQTGALAKRQIDTQRLNS